MRSGRSELIQRAVVLMTSPREEVRHHDRGFCRPRSLAFVQSARCDSPTNVALGLFHVKHSPRTHLRSPPSIVSSPPQ